MNRPRWRGLYGIVDVPAPRGRDPEELLGALLDGGAAIAQLRYKRGAGGAVHALAAKMVTRCRARGVPFIVNDRLDVALLVGADGAHLGQDDLPLAAARAIAPAGFLLGVSTHDLSQARAAVGGGADYIGFGPVFATATKQNPDPIVGVDALARACCLPVPVVAIGGITLEQVAEVARAGASAAAIISAVNGAADVRAAARAAVAAFGSA